MVQLIDVFKTYENGTRALKGVNIKLAAGEFAFLVGPSGSGKSTVIKLLTGEIAPTDGRVVVNGFNLESIKMRQMPLLRRSLGVIFQDFRLISKKTVYENVALPCTRSEHPPVRSESVFRMYWTLSVSNRKPR
jgi:cell division transport system ATP-binding protein